MDELKYVGPNEKIVEMAKEILEQNNAILAMNKILIDTLLASTFYVMGNSVSAGTAKPGTSVEL